MRSKFIVKSLFLKMAVFILISVFIGSFTSFGACDHSGGESTCTSKAVCVKCGKPYGETNPDKHAVTEIRDFVPATCGQHGYTGDSYCMSCGVLVERGNDLENMGDHMFTQWTVIKKPSSTEEGESKSVCDVCGVSYTQKLPKTAPSENSANSNTKKANEDPKFWITVLSLGTLSVIGLILYNKKSANKAK